MRSKISEVLRELAFHQGVLKSTAVWCIRSSMRSKISEVLRELAFHQGVLGSIPA